MPRWMKLSSKAVKQAGFQDDCHQTQSRAALHPIHDATRHVTPPRQDTLGHDTGPKQADTCFSERVLVLESKVNELENKNGKNFGTFTVTINGSTAKIKYRGSHREETRGPESILYSARTLQRNLIKEGFCRRRIKSAIIE